MRVMQCECGWLVSWMDFVRVNYDAECSRCGRRYSTFKEAPEIHIDANQKIQTKRTRKPKKV